jgi:hypothetical protein
MSERRYALLIGNQTYPAPSDFTPLNCPHADVDAMQDVLRDPERGAFHEVEVLKDAGRAETVKAITTALGRKDRDDLLLIYFSGHGLTDDHGDLYLAANDSEKQQPQATAIDARQLSIMMGRADAGKTVLILDCCHAGAFPTGFKSSDGLQATADSYARGGGCYVLMACDEFELARDGDEGELSLLTRHLVEGLRGAADINTDGRITVNELSDYLDRTLAAGDLQTFKQGGRNQQGEVLLSSSGLDAFADMLEKAEEQVIEWSKEGSVSRSVRAEVLTFISDGPNPNDSERAGLLGALKGVADGRLRPGDFTELWLRANTGVSTIAEAPVDSQPPSAEPSPPPGLTDPSPSPGLAEPAATWHDTPPPDAPEDPQTEYFYHESYDDSLLSPPFIATAATMLGLTLLLWLVAPWIFWGLGWPDRHPPADAGGMFMGLVFVMALVLSICWVLMFENQRSNGVQVLKLCLRTIGLWMFVSLSYEVFDPTGMLPYLDAWLDAP